ncbi:MAG: hypothetical protein M3237_21965 [Actinomycetota bacterium]|nr:hypothetical protein [Actinomycetota bacterium]
MTAMHLTTCPECGRPAEIGWRDVLESTDGPVEHARVTCIDGHWFLLPTSGLERASRLTQANYN